MLATHAHEIRLLAELATAVSLWAAIAAFVVVLRRRDGAIPALRGLLNHWLTIVLLAAAGAAPLIIALDISYSAPRDIMQDIVSADQLWQGRTMYPFPMTDQIRQMLEAQPVRWSLGSVVPALRAQEVRAYELAVSQHWVQAHPLLMTFFVAIPERLFGARPTILLMNAVSLASLGLVAWMLANGAGEGRIRPAAIVAIALCWYPVQYLVRLGQSGLLLAVLMVAGWYFLRKGNETAAGLAIGFATALKLYPGLLFVYLLFRARKALLVAAATAVASLAAIGWIGGWQVFAEYSKTVEFVTRTYQGYDSNYSLLGAVVAFLGAVGAPVSLARPIFIAMAAAMVLATVALGARSRGSDAFYASLVCLMPLLSPISWQHYWVVLLLPVFLLGREACREGWRALAVFCLLCALLSLPEPVMNEWCFTGLATLCLIVVWGWMATATGTTAPRAAPAEARATAV